VVQRRQGENASVTVDAKSGGRKFMNARQIKKLMLNELDIPRHKIEYVISRPVLVQGLWGCLAAYGVEHDRENHELLVEIVQDKLNEPDIEREWSELEYETFVKWGS